MMRVYLHHAAMHAGLALYLARRRRYGAALSAMWSAMLPPLLGLSPHSVNAFQRGSPVAWFRYALSDRGDEPLPGNKP